LKCSKQKNCKNNW